MLEKVKCNLFGSAEYNVLIQTAISPFATVSNLVRCEHCGLAYFNPRLSLDEELVRKINFFGTPEQLCKCNKSGHQFGWEGYVLFYS